MAHPTHVPKFGNWEEANEVPFTMVFDHARAGKGNTKMFNPNDPAENPAAFGLSAPPPREEERYAPVKTVQQKTSQQQQQHPTQVPKFGNWEQNDQVPFTMVFDNARNGKGNAKISDPNEAAVSQNKPLNAKVGEVDHKHPTHVPQFGNWEENNQVPFTMVFDNARAGKGNTKIINPNDPAENPAAFGLSVKPPAKVTENEQRQHEEQSNAEARRPSGNRMGSPYWERKNAPEVGNMIAPGTQGGKSRLNAASTRGDEAPDRGSALPKFGAWNVDDPNAGQGFTVIFDQARNEKKTGGVARVPAFGEPPAPVPIQRSRLQQQKSTGWGSCFGWCT